MTGLADWFSVAVHKYKTGSFCVRCAWVGCVTFAAALSCSVGTVSKKGLVHGATSSGVLGMAATIITVVVTTFEAGSLCGSSSNNGHARATSAKGLLMRRSRA